MTLILKKMIYGLILFFPLGAFSIATTFVSADDEDITLQSVAISPGHDNVQGIYAPALTNYLQTLIEGSRFLDGRMATSNTTEWDLNELRSSPTATSKLIRQLNADSLIHLQVSKGQMGLRYELGLFTAKTGQLWAYADAMEPTKLDLEYGKDIVRKLYQHILAQLPFQGLILSRQGNKVTVGRGQLGGLRPDQEIEVIQVVGVKRHPEFQFVTEVHKQVIGKIHITQVDETMGFGYIIFEREPQSLKVGHKLLIREPVLYPALASSKNEPVVDHLMARADGAVVLQGQSKEWKPEDPPTFGRAHFLFGLGDFGSGSKFETSGPQKETTLSASNASVDSDLWLTQNWLLSFALNQGTADLENPLAGSSPATITFALQNIKMGIGYDLGLSNDINGPRLKIHLANSQFKTRVTDNSPTSYTGSSFTATAVGLIGHLPLTDDSTKWAMGAEFWYHLSPRIKESPVKSGQGSNIEMSELSWLLSYKMNSRVSWMSKYSMNTYRSRFSGTSTRVGELVSSSEITWKYLNFGMEYLF